MPRILVADDDRTVRRNLATLLRCEGYEVLEAVVGAEALALIRSEGPDAVNNWGGSVPLP